MSTCPEYDKAAEFYDHVGLYVSREDVAFYVEMAQASGGPVLELGCGTGRVLLPIARAGIDVVGLDPATAMLEQCRQKLEAEPPAVRRRVKLVPGDARTFDLARQFPLVTMPFRVFQHLLSVADQRSALRRCRFHLAQNGRLVFDLFNPSIPFLADERVSFDFVREPEFTLPDGRRVVRSFRIAKRRYFEQQQDVEMRYEVTRPDGSAETATESFTLRYAFRYEIEHLLELEGFEVEAVYGGFGREPFGRTSYPGELIFVARKR